MSQEQTPIQISKEFIKYGKGDVHNQIVNTLIKELYVDTNVGLKVYQDSVLFCGGDRVADILESAFNIYKHKLNNNLTYIII